jgi:hypothetical protein
MDDLRKTQIKGKDYVDVSERVKAYWKLYPKGRIETEMLFFDHDKGFCVFKATVYDNDGKPKGNGHAHEYQADKSSMVNRTSYLENCETSAIGRAMAEAGILIEYGMASKQEIDAAKEKAKQMDKAEKPKPKPEPKPEPEAEFVPDETVPLKAEITKKLLDLNARAMEIKNLDDGKALRVEYEELVKSHGDGKMPSSLVTVFKGNLQSAYDSLTKSEMAAA